MASCSDVARANIRSESGKRDRNKKKDLRLTISKDGSDLLEDSGIGLDEGLRDLNSVFLGVMDSASKPPSRKEHHHPNRDTTTSSPLSAPAATNAASFRTSLQCASTSKYTGTPKGPTVVTSQHQQKKSNMTGNVLSGTKHSVQHTKLLDKTSRNDRQMSSSAHPSATVTVRRSVGQGHPQMTKESATNSSRTVASSSTVMHAAEFTMDSESEDDENSSMIRCQINPARSASEKSGGRESKGRNRFRRMLEGGLRRSHSAGCSQDVPAHALFLKHQTDLKQSVATSQAVIERSASASEQGQIGSDSEHEDPDRKSKSKKKSFARDIKEKMAFLRRRHTDTALSGKVGDNKSHRVTQESVAKWSQSFENLLFDKVGLGMFRDFLRSEFSEENLEFWIACEEYKNLKSAKIPEQAQKMYTDFVAVQAPREINLDSKTRMACREKLGSPNKHTFEEAQKRIQALMEKDSYPRFLHSDPYLELCNDLKINT